ncbi:zinc-finger [Actinopolyspora alba]|uniref:Zinc-finger n=1 Tax=Actinopolyspora alba TaxID=673379 RepID=A0A1I1TC90_9ACTN|nr:zinc finger protein [Actinopolyspora alba]SFD56222.1 zinc-finger [Actinopolyspora alba]
MSHPFTWVPGDRARHASQDQVPSFSGNEFPPDITVTTLCGQRVTSATGDLAWLWKTCRACDERTREIAGLEPLAEIERRIGANS